MMSISYIININVYLQLVLFIQIKARSFYTKIIKMTTVGGTMR